MQNTKLKTDFKPIDHTNWQKTLCFGCSQDNPYGLKMNFYSDEETVISMITVPDHLCGWNNLVHGGIIGVILDEIMGTTGIYLLDTFLLTKSMNTKFIKPLVIGEEIRVEGRIIDRTSEKEVVIGGRIFNENGEIAASAEALFAIVSPQRKEKFKIEESGRSVGFNDFLKRNATIKAIRTDSDIITGKI